VKNRTSGVVCLMLAVGHCSQAAFLVRGSGNVSACSCALAHGVRRVGTRVSLPCK
jgi:hypothetical protein